MVLLDIHRSYHSKIKQHILENNIDISHFKKMNKSSVHEKLCENSAVNSKSIKSYILKNKLLENKCALCNLLPIWNNKELILQLDHINGNHYDNRIQNLRFIWPNCHNQTETYTGQNTRNKEEKKCSDCNKILKANNTTLKCKECSDKEKHLCTVCKINKRPGNWSKCNECRKKNIDKQICKYCQKPLKRGTNLTGYHKKCFNSA